LTTQLVFVIITEVVSKNDLDRMLLDDFLNLLFWKNYTEGYVDIKDRDNIFKEIRKATKTNDYGDGEYDSLDTNKILPFINKIRKQIGLKELTNKLMVGTLIEVDDEVRKELILKEL